MAGFYISFLITDLRLLGAVPCIARGQTLPVLPAGWSSSLPQPLSSSLARQKEASSDPFQIQSFVVFFNSI